MIHMLTLSRRDRESRRDKERSCTGRDPSLLNSKVEKTTAGQTSVGSDAEGELGETDELTSGTKPEPGASPWGQVKQLCKATRALDGALRNGQALGEKDFEPALTQLEAIEIPEERYAHGLSVARIMVQAQHYDSALNFLAEQTIPPSVESTEAHFGLDMAQLMPSQVAGEVAQRGAPGEAIAFIQTMPDGMEKTLNQAVTHATVSNAYFAGQQGDKAEAAMARAESFAAQLPDSSEKGWVLMTIGAGRLAQGDRPVAQQLLGDAIALDPALKPLAQSFEASAEMMVQAALETADTRLEEIWTLLNPCLGVCVDSGLSASTSSASTSSASTSCDISSEVRPQEETLQRVEQLTAQLSDPCEQLNVWGPLAAAWERVGNRDRSGQRLASALRMVQTQDAFRLDRRDKLEGLLYDFAAAGGRWTVQQQALEQMLAEQIVVPKLYKQLMARGLAQQVYRTYGETFPVEDLQRLAMGVGALDPSPERRDLLLILVQAFLARDAETEAWQMVEGLDGGDRAEAIAVMTQATN